MIMKKTEYKTLAIRFVKDDVSLLCRVCNSRGEDLSSFIRRSVLLELARFGYFSNEKKKALGIDLLEVSNNA